ncbi:unnamed protein product [Brassica rapa subsp. narinosa]
MAKTEKIEFVLEQVRPCVIFSKSLAMCFVCTLLVLIVSDLNSSRSACAWIDRAQILSRKMLEIY